MNSQSPEQLAEIGKSERKEYTVVVDGVIAISSRNSTEFFNGLLDAILEYVEKYDAHAALSIAHQEYVETD